MLGILENLFAWLRDYGMQFFDAIAGTIKGVLMWFVAPGIRSVFTYTGLAISTYTAVINPLAEAARAAFGGIPGDLMAWIGFFQIDKVVTVLVSAYITSSVAGYLRIVKRTAEGP